MQMISKNVPLVSVVMITYQHEKFIQQAVESILIQEYAGQIELIVANDHSPDDTDSIINKIIKEHPCGSWIKYTNHTVNIGMMDNFIWALQQAKGKYIALCEGDDYWTDPLKLQKQVEYLENNEKYVLSFTKSMELFQDEMSLIETIYPKEIKELNFQELLSHDWFIRTASIVFRKNQFDHTFLNKLQYSADYFLQLLLIDTGKFHFLEDITSVYRHHSGGISNSSKNLFLKRRILFCVNLKNLNIYTDYKYNQIILDNIKKIEIDILDYAVLNLKFKYIYLIRLSNIISIIKHFKKRIKNKFF
jgi:glycosyltransferase involved in cell wall biosynthesis